MQVTTQLQNLFTYSFIPIIILMVIFLMLLFIFKKKKNIKTKKEIIVFKPKDVLTIKNKYLKNLDELIINTTNNKITNRKSYQSLSLIIRNFIYEMTEIKVQNYSLSEIDQIKMPVLYELVSEYYDPEFSYNSHGDILSSISKTKEVIRKWS